MPVQWFTLRYQYSDGTRQTLYNLQAAGCSDIERAQRGLGSSNFEREAQPHHYDQFEIALIRK